jgi:hypothetical protein
MNYPRNTTFFQSSFFVLVMFAFVFFSYPSTSHAGFLSKLLDPFGIKCKTLKDPLSQILHGCKKEDPGAGGGGGGRRQRYPPE